MDNERLMWLVGIGVLLAGFLALRNGIFSTGTPAYQPSSDAIEGLGGYQNANLATVTLEPQHHIGDVTYLPVRYPVHCGENISTLIMNGFDPLWQNKPADFAWMQAPPSEVSI